MKWFKLIFLSCMTCFVLTACKPYKLIFVADGQVDIDEANRRKAYVVRISLDKEYQKTQPDTVVYKQR